MSRIDFRKLCLQFSQRLSPAFIERIERRLDRDFDEAIEKESQELLITVLQDIQLYYINPFEMTLELSKYLRENHDVSRFSLSLSENFDFPISDRIEEASNMPQSKVSLITAILYPSNCMI